MKTKPTNLAKARVIPEPELYDQEGNSLTPTPLPMGCCRFGGHQPKLL